MKNIIKSILITFLIQFSIFGYPQYISEFLTNEGKRIILIGDCHEKLTNELEAELHNSLVNFFNNQEKKENKTIILLEVPKKSNSNYKFLGQTLSFFFPECFLGKLSKFIDNNNYHYVNFKDADIRSLTLFDTYRFLKFIESLENYIFITSFKDSTEERKQEYYKLLNVTIKDYECDIFKKITEFETLVEKYPDLKDFIENALTFLKNHLMEFKTITQSLSYSDSILKLILEKQENYNFGQQINDRINKLIELICFPNNKIAEVGFAKDTLDSLETHDTVVLICGNMHATELHKYFCNNKKYKKTIAVGKLVNLSTYKPYPHEVVDPKMIEKILIK